MPGLIDTHNFSKFYRKGDSEPCFPGALASQYAHGTRAGLTSGFGMGPGVSLPL